MPFIAKISATELQGKINSDLRKIGGWLLANRLSLNIMKSEYMLIGSRFKVSNFGSFAPIEINGSEIKKVTSLKHLGVYIDQNLNWDAHIDSICKKVGKSIYGLKQVRDFVPVDTLIIMYKALIQPTFDYCDLVWSNLNKGLADRLQKLQNRAARIITFQGYDVRSVDILQELNWDNLQERRDKRLCLLMFDILHNNCPSYLSNLFIYRSVDAYKSKLRQNNQIEMQHIPKTYFFKSSFHYRGAKSMELSPL